ncbi:MAG TPA: tRNA-binding protein [Chloroflexota bacterium]|jgi:tRNA-binding protein|nr:tRNA-binding protein [Chloroflexota bacterium]
MADDGLRHFEQVDMRLGRIVAVEDFPEARKPAFKLTIDLGEHGIRRSSAQLTVHYTKAQLLGRLVIAVVSLPPRRVAGFKSEVLVLGVPDADGQVILIEPERDAPIGGRVF